MERVDQDGTSDPTQSEVAAIYRLLRIGDFDVASATATRMLATAFGPTVYQSAFAAFVAAGDFTAAAALVARVPVLSERTAYELRLLSSEACMTNNVKLALFLALAAVTLERDNAEFRIHLGSLLCEDGLLAFAEAMLLEAIALDETRGDAHRVLSAVFAARRMRSEALRAIEAAIQLRPDVVDYRVHAAGLYVDAEMPHEAIYHLTCGLTQDRENDLLWRLLSAAYLQVGKTRFSIEAASRAAMYSESHAEYKFNLILNYGSNAAARLDDSHLASTAADFAFVPGLIQRKTTFASVREAFAVQSRVIWALMLRETRTIYGSSKIGYFWAVFEPLSHLALLYAVFIILGHSAVPPIGDNMLVFYFSGLLPYLCFAHGSEKAMHVIASNVSILGFPQISVLDVVLGRTFLSIITDLFVLFLVFGIFTALGYLPAFGDILDMVTAYLVLITLTIGTALINSVLSSYMDAWEKVWPTFLRVQYFTCGLFYHPSSMPDWIREILSYNPIFHVLEWFRQGFFHDYRSEFLDRGYVVVFAILTLAAGLCVEFAVGKRLKGRA